MRARKIVIACLLGAAIAGCMNETDPIGETTGTGAAALDGTNDLTDRGTVALCEGPTSGECAVRCSGVLLTPNLVLTARHCSSTTVYSNVENCATTLFDSNVIPANTLWVSSAPNVPAVGGTYAQGTEWVFPQASLFCGQDVALLRLASSIDDPVLVTPSFATGPALHASSGKFTSIGYGGAPSSPTVVGARHEAPSTLTCVGEIDSCKSVAADAQLQASEILLNLTVCPGDSGGPAIDENGNVTGIVSRTVNSNGSCGTAVYSLLSEHALLLARTATEQATAANVAAPAWVETAMTVGNGGGVGVEAYGAPCDSDADCASNTCRSQDVGQTWQCSSACNPGSCPSGSSCLTTAQGSSCFVPAQAATSGSSGCAIADAPASGSSRTSDAAWMLVTLGGLAGAIARGRQSRQRRRAPVCVGES